MARRYPDSGYGTRAWSGQAYPVTLAAWVRLAAVGAVTRTILSVRDSTLGATLGGWFLRMNASEQVIASTAGSTSSASATITSPTLQAGVWAHVAGTFNAAANRYVYLNGVQSAVNTTSRNFTGVTINSIQVGAQLHSTGGTPTVAENWNGDIFWPSFWYGAELSTEEIRMLAAGISPSKIRRESLAWFIDKNQHGAADLSLLNTLGAEYVGSEYTPDIPPQVAARLPRRTARIYGFSAGAGSLNVSATTDALTLAEYAATIGKSLNIAATTDALTLAEYPATIGAATNISATTDALTLAEHPATIGLGLNIQATTDALTLTEYPASLGNTQNVQATTDALTLTEYPATLSFALNVSATTDSLTLVEYAATISDASAVVTPTVTGGGVGHGRKRRKKRVMVDGYVYLVDEAEERALLARLAAEKGQEAQLLEALGDPQTAAEVRRKAFRIARRADMADPYDRIRKDDEEVISRFIGLLAA